MERVVEIATPVFGLGLLGYVATRAGWFSQRAAEGLARFVFDFAVPLMLVRVFCHARLPEAFPWRLLASFYVPASLLYGAGLLVSGRFFRRDFMGRVITGFGCSFGNSVLLGLPLALLTFGEEGAIPFLILVSVHGLGYLTVTTMLLEYGRRSGQPRARLLVGIAKGLITNPILLGLAAGLVMNRSGLGLSGPLDRLLEHMQLAVTPCALFSLGASLTRYRIAGGLLESVCVVSVKNVAMPAIVWLIAAHGLELPRAWVLAATLLAAQPSGVNIYLFAERYGAARDLATTTVFLSTAFSLLTIPALLYLFELSA